MITSLTLGFSTVMKPSASIMAAVIMGLGLNYINVASSMASRLDLPFWWRSFANRTMRMPGSRT